MSIGLAAVNFSIGRETNIHLRVVEWSTTGGEIMAADDGDPFEQGKLAQFNNEPHENPYPRNTEQHQRWEAGYRFVELGLTAV